MKRKHMAFLLLFLLLLSGCANNTKAMVKIAVMGNPSEFHPCYQEGIERAVRDLNEEYADSGYTVLCEFYSDNGNYEDGAVIIDTLAEDQSITAVIGAVDMEINATAAHVFDASGKLLVVPHYLYDSVYEEHHYTTVLSMCNAASTVGAILRSAARDTNAKRWAICAADREFERVEMNGFLRSGDIGDGITVVDCTSMSMLINQFEEVYRLWEILGVEGVVLLAEDSEGFEALRNIKKKNPAMICAGDSAFDNSALTENNEELKQAITGFIIADEYLMRNETPEETERIDRMVEEYSEKTAVPFDMWYLQGYNAVRMIADTAIQNQTLHSAEIARLLRKNGYHGLCQDFAFYENGAQAVRIYQYNVFDANNTATPVAIAR